MTLDLTGGTPIVIPFKCSLAECKEPDVAYYVNDDGRVIEHPSANEWADNHYSDGEVRFPNRNTCWYAADLTIRPGWDIPPDFLTLDV